jgi:hypothetical protein
MVKKNKNRVPGTRGRGIIHALILHVPKTKKRVCQCVNVMYVHTIDSLSPNLKKVSIYLT